MEGLDFSGTIALLVFFLAGGISVISLIINLFAGFYFAYAREEDFYKQKGFSRLVGNILFVSIIFYCLLILNQDNTATNVFLDNFCIPIVLVAMLVCYIVRTKLHTFLQNTPLY